MYSSTSYGPSYPHLPLRARIGHKVVYEPLPLVTRSAQAEERKFSNSMYGAAFGFLLEDGEGRRLSEGDVVKEEKKHNDRRLSTQSEKIIQTKRNLPPQKPAPSQPLPPIPAQALPQREPTPLPTEIVITLSPKHTSRYTPRRRPSIVAMAPFAEKSDKTQATPSVWSEEVLVDHRIW